MKANNFPGDPDTREWPELGKCVLTLSDWGTFRVDYLTPKGWFNHNICISPGRVIAWWELPDIAEIPSELFNDDDEEDENGA